jgi:hypothetical protein
MHFIMKSSNATTCVYNTRATLVAFAAIVTNADYLLVIVNNSRRNFLAVFIFIPDNDWEWFVKRYVRSIVDWIFIVLWNAGKFRVRKVTNYSITTTFICEKLNGLIRLYNAFKIIALVEIWHFGCKPTYYHSRLLRGAVSALRRAIAEVKQRWSIFGLVT